MPTLILQPQPYRRMVRVLREFEGWRTLWWRLPLSALAFVGVPLFAIGAGVLAAAIGGDDFGLSRAVVAAVVATAATAYIQPRLAGRELHRKLIGDRLWTWEKPNPATEVPVLLRDHDVCVARTALRHARFNPGVLERVGTPPSDAPDLVCKIAVQEPEAWPQSASDEDRTRRIADALDAAGVRARVAGLDVPRRAAAYGR